MVHFSISCQQKSVYEKVLGSITSMGIDILCLVRESDWGKSGQCKGGTMEGDANDIDIDEEQEQQEELMFCGCVDKL